MTPELKAKLNEARQKALLCRTACDKRMETEFTEKQRVRLAEIRRHSVSAINVFKKAYGGNSLAAAVKAKCLDCCCWVREEVTKCRSEACPLWRVRPFQKGGE